MILQFPVADLRAVPGWGPGSLIEMSAFGPIGGAGFSERLSISFAGVSADLVASFDGYLRRLMPAGGDPDDPAVFELQPLVTLQTAALADGIDALPGALPAEPARLMPRLRWHNVDPAAAEAALTAVIEDQVTATDTTQQVERVERFLNGELSIFLERGAVLAAGVSTAEVELTTRDGVAVDPLAYYAYYLQLPADPNDALGDRDWLSVVFNRLTRRALVQVLDEHGLPLAEPVSVRRPGGALDAVDVTATGGMLVAAEFTAAGSNILIESIEVPEPALPAGEQPAERFLLISEWPSGAPAPLGPVAIAPATRPGLRRFAVTHLRAWFASQHVPAPASDLPRYTLGNQVTPLIDGIPTYLAMYQDIKHVLDSGVPAGSFYYLCGWGLTPKVRLNQADPDSGWRAMLEQLDAAGGTVRVMLWNELHIESEELLETMATGVLIVYLISTGAATLIPPIAPIVFVLLTSASIGLALLEVDSVQNWLSNKFENNQPIVEELGAIGNLHVLLDGKVRQTRTTGSTHLYDFIGSHHQKISAISSPDGTFAYLGGIDVNKNRVETPEHLDASPYHDVHCRLAGPSAADVAVTIRQRWNDQQPDDAGEDGPLGAAPIAGATHVVQVARTYPNKLSTAGDAYDFAPDGDFTIRDTLLSAVQQARRYIYIEDQYMTPPPVIGDAIAQRLRDVPELKLVMVMPRASDQPENTSRRAMFIGNLLQEFGPDRILAFYPTRRSFAHDSERHGPVQTRLIADLNIGELEIQVADASAFSDKGVVLIDEEEISYSGRDLAARKLTLSDLSGRGHNFTDNSLHRIGTNVRQVSYQDIFVHTKVWVIDDIFAAIGSANLNNRGMNHDSECTAMIIDGRLDRSAGRLVKQFRIDLWAEHLGFFGSAGARLLLDSLDEAMALLASNPGPSGTRLRRYWHTWNFDLKPESWLGWLDPGLYWDALLAIDPFFGDDFWLTYIDPDGTDPLV
jgi:phosphatidylserine/phosphatidylglycerophosphate/cardiolipin synthase-like enzyme